MLGLRSRLTSTIAQWEALFHKTVDRNACCGGGRQLGESGKHAAVSVEPSVMYFSYDSAPMDLFRPTTKVIAGLCAGAYYLRCKDSSRGWLQHLMKQPGS